MESNDIDLISLRLFVRVASSGRFAEAARHFGLPASSVSRRIARLEKALGHRLLYRHTRAVRLTEVGERYFLQVRDLLDELDRAAEQVSGAAGQPRGTLRVNAPVAFGRRHIAPLLAAFQSRYPAIDVDMTLTDAFVDPVQEGADVVIRIGSLADSSLVGRQLAEQHHVVCAAPAYLSRHGQPDTPEALQEHNCLVYKGTRGEQPWYFRGEGEATFRVVEVRGNLRSNNAECLVEAALQGQGLILFPTWLIDGHLRQGTLVPILDAWESAGEPARHGIHVIYPENRLRSSKVSAFLDYLFEHAPRLDVRPE
ncbi:LysR family transcriptional regulator [Marinobacter bohaiensis]|uniref:LysR family transcriptional regulator n=1 Tax=Marinobacter bohaiensis TaxID=2201898 RepID=UPI00195511AC|nr:LysR family transcriptional regulator [Marinobacter bohaiensis]